ncbi:CHAT domain-containing protein [Boletus edulis]|nr:CHAT domain-containing protein [Boletus edulis]
MPLTSLPTISPTSPLDAISLYSYAASSLIGPVSLRFHISQRWISCARRMDHPSLFYAYSVVISLFPQLAWTALSLTHRQYELTQCADLVREAAATALDSGFPETAVEWLEQGRSIVCGELAQLCSSSEELSSAYPDHARRLRELSAALMYTTGATHEECLSALSEQSPDTANHATKVLQEKSDRYRALALERDKLLHEIQRLPSASGFERFFPLKGFSQLRASAHSGPVVMLNAAESRCDALVVLADVDHVIHVPLPNFTFKQSIHLLNLLRSLRHGRVLHIDERDGKSAASDGVSWEYILAHLWKCVVKPVLDALAFSTLGELSRIFWCPTGPFASLPIHAAGLYDTRYSQPGHKVFDFVVSSYVPTLSILALSRNFSMASNGDLRLLAVRQPPSDGLPQLLGVDTELRCIKEVVRSSPSARTTFLMKEADWVHFACHGIQDTASPTESGFCLADGRRLKVSDIVALSRPRGGLAFLSACQTATGDEGHLEAGMLFAGYGGVIGSMWSISDSLAPDVVRDVYEQLLRSGTRPDYREAARALYDAVGCLRDSGKASFHEWIPFIHVGL